jgi:hypothetical protein
MDGPLVAINGNGRLLGEVEGSQVVDAVAVIGMGMREKDRVDPADTGTKRLLAKIRARVDDQALPVRLNPE